MKNIRLTEKGMKVIIILIVILLISYLIYIPFKSKNLNTQEIADLTLTSVYGLHGKSYKPISKEVMQDFLNDFNYEGRMDCIGIAFTFQAAVRNKFGNVAVGVTCNDTHMFNFFIDKDNELYFIEAQSTHVKGIYPKQHQLQGSLIYIVL